MRRLTFIAFTAALLAGACTSGPDVRHDADAAVSFDAYKTFGFFEPPPVPGQYTSLLGARLREATRSQLEGRYAYAEQNPDLRVHLFLSVIERQELRSTPAARPHAFAAWGGQQIEGAVYRQGLLRIDIVDTRRNRLVWRGVAEGRLDEQAMANPGPLIEQTVKQVFAAFPGAGPKAG
jgi:hypothetical protein